MGMSIDEALKVWLPVIQMGVETLPECKEALDMVIDTMRKYQKIEEIVDEWKHDHDNLNYADDSYYWSKVREVLEDGNDD